MDCVFCKIINQKIPARIIYDDEYCLAFLDIEPVNIGHTLVIPKKHYRTLTDIDDKTLKHIIIVVKNIAQKIKDQLGYSDYKIVMNNGVNANQLVHHAHFHIIPRTQKTHHEWKTIKISDDELKEVQNKLL